MRFIRLIVRRVVRGLGHLDFSSILSLNGDSKVPIFLFSFLSLFLSVTNGGGVPYIALRTAKRNQKILGHRQLNTHEQKKQPRRQRKTQI